MGHHQACGEALGVVRNPARADLLGELAAEVGAQESLHPPRLIRRPPFGADLEIEAGQQLVARRLIGPAGQGGVARGLRDPQPFVLAGGPMEPRRDSAAVADVRWQC